SARLRFGPQYHIPGKALALSTIPRHPPRRITPSPTSRRGVRMRKLVSTCASLFAASIATLAISQVPVPGDDQFASGQFEEAQRPYEQRLAEKPDDAPALARLARSRLLDDQVDQAIDLARKALAAAPNNPVAANVLNTAQARKSAFDPNNFGM